jgi:REP element-mobilizing transposase RayT
MARLPRLSIAGCPQHIIQRGNNRQACFFAEQDYTVYLDKLKDSTIKHNVSIHAFVLMTNHVHINDSAFDRSEQSSHAKLRKILRKVRESNISANGNIVGRSF